MLEQLDGPLPVEPGWLGRARVWRSTCAALYVRLQMRVDPLTAAAPRSALHRVQH